MTSATVERLRLPPHAIECEQSVIGALLLDNSAYDRIADQLSDLDFYRDEHKRIYRAICSLVESGREADVLTVTESLQESGQADHFGGLAYLGEIANNTPSSANIGGYARVVRQKRILRDILATGSRLIDMAYTAIDAESAIEEAQNAIGVIAETGAGRGDPVRMQDALAGVVADLDARCASGTHTAGISTGFADMDNIMSGGLQPGDMIVIAGRPSMGKTAFALNVAEHVAISGKCVAFFSLEMRAEQLAMRSLASIGHLNIKSIRSAHMEREDWAKVTAATVRLRDCRLQIDDSAPPNISAIGARARRLMRSEGLDLIVIDYLQLLESPGDNRNEQVSQISRSIKALARELRIPVVVLSQLSRSVESRPNKRPIMSDLRDSGSIEQDADVVIMAYRDDYYNEATPDKGVAEMIVRKNRMGEVGTVKLLFTPEQSRFDNLAQNAVQYSLMKGAGGQNHERMYSDALDYEMATRG